MADADQTSREERLKEFQRRKRLEAYAASRAQQQAAPVDPQQQARFDQIGQQWLHQPLQIRDDELPPAPENLTPGFDPYRELQKFDPSTRSDGGPLGRIVAKGAAPILDMTVGLPMNLIATAARRLGGQDTPPELLVPPIGQGVGKPESRAEAFGQGASELAGVTSTFLLPSLPLKAAGLGARAGAGLGQFLLGGGRAARLAPTIGRYVGGFAGGVGGFTGATRLPDLIGGNVSPSQFAGETAGAGAHLVGDVATIPTDLYKQSGEEGLFSTPEAITKTFKTIEPLAAIALAGKIKKEADRAQLRKEQADAKPVAPTEAPAEFPTGFETPLLNRLAEIRKEREGARTDAELQRLAQEQAEITNRLKQGPDRSVRNEQEIQRQQLQEQLAEGEGQSRPLAEENAGRSTPGVNQEGQVGTEGRITREIAENAKSELGYWMQNKIDRVVDLAKSTKTIGEVAVSRGLNVIERLGDTGQKIAREARLVEGQARQRVANDIQDLRRIFDVVPKFEETSKRRDRILNKMRGIPTYTLHERMLQALEGRYPEAQLPKEARERLPEVREILDRNLKAAQELGSTRKVGDTRLEVAGSGKPVPQIPNAAGERFLAELRSKGAKSPRIVDWATKEVEAGKFETIEEAIKTYREWDLNRMRNPNAYLERARTIELPTEYREWDPSRALDAVLEQSARTVEAKRQFGENFEKLEAALTLLEKESGNPSLVNQIRDFFKIELGDRELVNKDAQKFFQAMSNYETVSKLGFSLLSPLRNSFQPFINSTRFPFSVQLQALKELPPIARAWLKTSKEIEDQARRSGAVTGRSSLSEIESGATRNISQHSMRPFMAVETGNQIRAARIAQLGIERELAELADIQSSGRLKNLVRGILATDFNREATIKRNLKKSALNDRTPEQMADLVQRGQMTPQEMAEAQMRFVTDTQFALTMLNRPLWWQKQPMFRLLAKFKPFVVEQTKLIYRDVVKEAAYGNFGPFRRFMTGVFIAGELYNIARDTVVGDDESLTKRFIQGKDIKFENFLNNIKDGGGVGIIADLTYGIGNFIGGPTLSTIGNMAETATNVIHRPSQTTDAVKNFIKDEFVVSKQVEGGYMRAQDVFGDTPAGDYFRYRDARKDAFRFKTGQKPTEDQIKDPLITTLNGVQKFMPAKNTLQFEMAARQITLHDVEDAGKTIKYIMADAKTPSERVEIRNKIRTALDRRSPLGSLNQIERLRYLNSLTPQRKAEIQEFDLQWRRRMTEAMRLSRS